MFLTYLGSLEGDEENQIENEEPETKPGQRFYVAACPRLEGKHAKAQRYAVASIRTPKLFTFSGKSNAFYCYAVFIV